MKSIFSAIFESLWKRKETKFFLVFGLYPFVYFVSSFFGNSNFMQIYTEDSAKIGYLDFADTMFNSMDMLLLPTLALYFLTISVFRKETDDHTMFLYKDINKKDIYLSKYFSLILILMVYFLIFFVSSLIVHYGRVVHMDFGTTRFTSDTLYYTLIDLLNMFVIFLKGIVSISIAALVSLYFGVGVTMTTAMVFTLTMTIVSMMGSPIAIVFPSGYKQFVEVLSDTWIGFLGPISITLIYVICCNIFSLKKFKNLEF